MKNKKMSKFKDINPEKTALLILDVQNEFVSEKGRGTLLGTPKVFKERDTIGKLKKVREKALLAGMSVIHIITAYKADYSDAPKRGPLSLVKRLGILKEGEWGSDIPDELKPTDKEEVVVKKTNNGFYRTNLDEICRSKSIETLIFTGYDTCYCVESTFRAAVDRDFRLIVLKDCLVSINRSHEESIIRNVFPVFGAIVSTSEEFINSFS
jgi:nicotinamidase-related amidase